MIRRRIIAIVTALVFAASVASAQEVDARYTEGVSAFNAGDYVKCIAEMNASMELKPTSNAALYLGNAHLKLGQLGLAKTSLERALALDPKMSKRATLLKLIKGIDAAQTARVHVITEPVGAKVYVDAPTPDAFLGTTPADIRVIPGSHDIYVMLDGYETEKRTREFKTGERVGIGIALHRRGCVLTVAAEPATARIRIDDGAEIVVRTEARLTVGTHKIFLSAPGFESQTLETTCLTGELIELTPKLVAVVVKGRVRVAAPAGTTVTIDGHVLDQGEIARGLTLPVGSHEVAFSGTAAGVTRSRFDVVADRETVLAPPPPPPSPKPPPFRTGVYLGLIGGANIPLNEWNLGTNTHGAYPTAYAMGGLRVGAQLGARFAIEGEAQWVGLPNRLGHGLGSGLTTDGNVLVHLLRGRWTPVLEAGAGSYEVLRSALGKDIDARFHAGIGLRGAIGDSFAVRLDARDVITDGFDRSVGNNLEILLGIETFLWRVSGK